MKVFLRRIVFSFLLCVLAWLVGLAWFIGQIPDEAAEPLPQADAIVALTGGSGRVEEGLRLLAEGKASRLFISGVHDNTTAETLVRRAPADIRQLLADKRIIIGHEAENTIGNAEEAARWLEKEQVRSILLVTTNYHMPRSIKEFKAATHGILIIPAPVFSDDFTLATWWKNEVSRRLLLSEYHKFFAGVLRHKLVKVLE